MNDIAVPDVVEHELADEDEFLVLACDGKVSKGHKFFFATVQCGKLNTQRPHHV